MESLDSFDRGCDDGQDASDVGSTVSSRRRKISNAGGSTSALDSIDHALEKHTLNVPTKALGGAASGRGGRSRSVTISNLLSHDLPRPTSAATEDRHSDNPDQLTAQVVTAELLKSEVASLSLPATDKHLQRSRDQSPRRSNSNSNSSMGTVAEEGGMAAAEGSGMEVESHEHKLGHRTSSGQLIVTG